MSGNLRLSDFTFRRALPEDYDGVMRISDGLYNGMDFIPSVYHEYVQDPNRLFCVAVNKHTGEIASFGGYRVMDDGKTCEGEAHRTDPALQGKKLYLLPALNLHMTHELLKHWPQLVKWRGVTVNVEAGKNSKVVATIPEGLRDILLLIHELPNDAYLIKIAAVHPVNFLQQLSPLKHTVACREQDLYEVFNDAPVHRHLFPSGVIVRDSQTFSVGKEFTSNIAMMQSDRLTSMYITRCSQTRRITSLSFGTAIESSVKRRILRYCIDYYGHADADVIKCHVLKHLLDAEQCVRQSKTAEVVCCHVFVLHHVTTAINAGAVQEFVWNDLDFGRCREMNVQQLLGEWVVSVRDYLKTNGKL